MPKYRLAGLVSVLTLLLTAGGLGIGAESAAAAGNQNCAAIDGCVWQGTNRTGKYRGFNANAFNYGSLQYSDTSSLANNVRSWQFSSNPTYFSFCLYDYPNYIGALVAGNNVGFWGNVTHGSESSRFLVQPAC